MIVHAVPLWRPLDSLRYTSTFPLEKGDLIKVPLGRETVSACVVLTEEDTNAAYSQGHEGLKSVVACTAKGLFPGALMELAAKISSEHMGFLGEAAGLMLPREIMLPPKRPIKSSTRTDAVSLAIRSDEQTLLELIGLSKKPVLVQSSADYTALVVSLAREVLKKEKQMLILLPDEPSLVRFHERFSKLIPVRCYHSGIGQAERRRIWHGVNQGSVGIVAGLRSAAFLPARNLDCVLVFDADSGSYKERTHHLHYDAIDVILKRTSAEGVLTVLFSPSPTLEVSHMARTGKFLRIERRVKQQGKALVIDMKREKDGEALSSTLKELMLDTFARRMQSLLILNRLGTAARLLCLDCGNVLSCTSCSLPLKYKKPGADLECPLCRKKYPAPERCPQCSGSRWSLLSPGVARLTDDLRKLFPGARAVEITSDRRPPIEEVEHADIIYGTSAVLEYLPPRVQTAAFLSWDAERSRSDFRALEHVFRDVAYIRRLLSSTPDSRLVIQSFRPRDFTLNWALRGDYESFFLSETRKRRELGYPPYRRLVIFERTSLKNAWDAEKLASLLSRDGVEILGPYTGRQARETLLVKLRRDLSPANLMDARVLLKSGWQAEVDPREME